MRLALLTRPIWEHEKAVSSDSRIVAAPLQRLNLLKNPDLHLNNLTKTADAWIVFTSPASAEAFGLCMEKSPIGLPAKTRIAAVGRGTADRVAQVLGPCVSKGAIANMVVGESAHKATALALLDVLAESGKKSRTDWTQATMLAVEGRNNRPTLYEGLVDLGATVLRVEIYERSNVDWDLPIIEKIRASQPLEVAIVVTSGAAIGLALAQLKRHGVDPRHLRWCTHHESIASQIAGHRLLPVGRVRLAPGELAADLFDDPNFWQ